MQASEEVEEKMPKKGMPTIGDIISSIQADAKLMLREYNFSKKKLETMKKTLELLKEEGLTPRVIRMANSITCFGDIVYCCSVAKECPLRDFVLHVIGWDWKDYTRFKLEMRDELIRRIAGRYSEK